MKWYKISQSTPPWKMTQKEFLDYHFTGDISQEAYEGYKTPEGFKWNKIEDHPILVDAKQFGNYEIEFRQTGRKLQYVDHTPDGEIKRDESGQAVNMTDDEAKAKGLQLYDPSMTAFHNGQAIGMSSDEWGSDGIWVAEDYQKLGIGTYLIQQLRSHFKPERKMGQMTAQGKILTRRLHEKAVIKALEEGQDVPQEVLKDYPHLINPDAERPLTPEQTWIKRWEDQEKEWDERDKLKREQKSAMTVFNLKYSKLSQ